MIDVNSNCSRVDAVKAQATLLKLQSTAAASPVAKPDDPGRKVKTDLQSLDTQIKANDAKKAELALAVTKKDVDAAKTASHPDDGQQPFRGLDVYA